jgi:hypothetical protein
MGGERLEEVGPSSVDTGEPTPLGVSAHQTQEDLTK